jgi:hypothetical protein
MRSFAALRMTGREAFENPLIFNQAITAGLPQGTGTVSRILRMMSSLLTPSASAS